MGVDRDRAIAALRALLQALGHDPAARADLRDTPERAAEAWIAELLVGYTVDPADLLTRGSERLDQGVATGPVVLRDLSVVSVCPHHLLPSLGRATVAYLPGGLLLGLGTVARLVDALARRLTFQEEIGTKVVGALMEHGQARGAWCRLSMQQLCVCARGTRQAGSLVLTSARAGAFEEAGAWAELALLVEPGSSEG
jgi:GTP cyclohydrolase I